VIVPVVASHPPLDFYSGVAVVVPVLFLAVMVELRLSAAAPSLEAESADDLAMRMLLFLGALVGGIVGEAAALRALWYGHGSTTEGFWALFGLVILGEMLVLPLLGRLRLVLRSGGPERTFRAVRLVVQLVAVIVVGGLATLLVGRL
jgi:hypothetical protein